MSLRKVSLYPSFDTKSSNLGSWSISLMANVRFKLTVFRIINEQNFRNKILTNKAGMKILISECIRHNEKQITRKGEV